MSVTQSCLTLSDRMDCSMPGFPVLHYLPEFAQTHIHWVSVAIQPSHPLSSPSPAFNLSQHQGLFKWLSSSYHIAKVLELQHQPFQLIFRVDFFLGWLIWSPCCPRDSQESSPTPHFESINSLVLSLHYGPTLTSIPTNIGDLISGSSAFSKLSLYIWKFPVYVLQKPSLKDFQRKFTSLGN